MSNLDRYPHKISEIWTEQAKLGRWVALELAHLRTLAKIGKEPSRVSELLTAELRGFDIEPEDREQFAEDVKTMELVTGHDVGAFLEVLEKKLLAAGADNCARWLHYGLTSSDIVDSAVSSAVYQSMTEIAEQAGMLSAALDDLPEILTLAGRTHGQVASPISLKGRFGPSRTVIESVNYPDQFPVMFSGAVGQHRILSHTIAQGIADRYYSGRAYAVESTTQVLPADWLLDQLHQLSKLVMAVDQIATNLRAMSMLGEYLPQAQRVGSSTMPSKVNPFEAERLCGMAVHWRSLHQAVLNSRVLWLERDMSHSVVDRLNLPGLFQIAAYMLQRAVKLLDEATFRPQPMYVFEPEVDADLLFARATSVFAGPRSQTYKRVRTAIEAERHELGNLASSVGAFKRLGAGVSESDPSPGDEAGGGSSGNSRAQETSADSNSTRDKE